VSGYVDTEPAIAFFHESQFGYATSHPACSCWDIPKSSCCYCGAETYYERESWNHRNACIKRDRSFDAATWAFGMEWAEIIERARWDLA